MGRQQATSSPAPIWFLQKYQITAGILNLAQISPRGKSDHFPEVDCTIFAYICISIFFFLFIFFQLHRF